MMAQQKITDQGFAIPDELMSVENYNLKRGIWSPLVEHNGIVTGYWMPGNCYRQVKKYYGAYPPGYLDRLALLFPNANNVLHIFSGVVDVGNWPNETRVDINPDIEAELHFNVSLEWPILGFDLILADPPYEDNHVRYGTEKINKRKTLKHCVKALNPGGYLVWLDTRIPVWAKKDGWKLRGTIGMVQSTNCLTKTITILKNVSGRDAGRRGGL